MTRDVRESIAKSTSELSESCKRRLRGVRASAINAASANIKNIDIRRRGEAEIQNLYLLKAKIIDEMVSKKCKELLA